MDAEQTANVRDGRRSKQHDQPASPYPAPLRTQPPAGRRRLTLSTLTGEFRPLFCDSVVFGILKGNGKAAGDFRKTNLIHGFNFEMSDFKDE